MPTKWVDFEDLKQRVSIEDILKWLAIDLKGSGKQLRGQCPMCHGSDRGFVVTPAKGLWHCFNGCGGGDIIALVSKYNNVSLRKAALDIEEHFSGERESVPERTSPRQEGGIKPLSYLQAEHEKVQNLGVDKETAEAFSAGYANKGIMRGRLAIPIYSRQGELVAYCGRAVDGSSPTLQFPNGFTPEDYIFNAHSVGAGELYLTRDPLQVLTAYQNGIENCVAFLTDAISAQQLEQLASLMDQVGAESVELF